MTCMMTYVNIGCGDMTITDRRVVDYFSVIFRYLGVLDYKLENDLYENLYVYWDERTADE